MPAPSTILILDHGRCITDRIAPAPRRAGCTVLHFEDGEDAWAHALKTRVDRFVIDAELPYSDDGLYFLGNIRAKPFYAQTPVYGRFSEPMDARRPSARYRSYYHSGMTAAFVKDAGMDALLLTILRPAGSEPGAAGADTAPPHCADTARNWCAPLDWLDRAGRPDLWI